MSTILVYALSATEHKMLSKDQVEPTMLEASYDPNYYRGEMKFE